MIDAIPGNDIIATNSFNKTIPGNGHQGGGQGTRGIEEDCCLLAQVPRSS